MSRQSETPKKRLAIIPARGGSKRIPKKNIKDFCGRPMIAHVLDAVSQSGMFTKVHVSTDSGEVAEAARVVGFAPEFLRPPELSGDHTSMLEVYGFVAREFTKRGENFDTIAIIYATSPLVAPEDLAEACAQFEQGDGNKPLLAVTPYPAPIEHAFRMNGKTGNLIPDAPDKLSQRTQDITRSYFDAGMFAFYTPEFLISSAGPGDFLSFRGFEVPGYRVTDLDWPDDWERAENLYRALGSGDGN
jgi:pseudaminic acid cytidylyltransferase